MSDEQPNERLLPCEVESLIEAFAQCLDRCACPAITVRDVQDGGVSLHVHFSTERARRFVKAWNTRVPAVQDEGIVERLEAELVPLRKLRDAPEWETIRQALAAKEQTR